MKARPLARVLAAGTCAVLLLSGCGTRASDAEIQAGAGGGPVQLPQSALDELKAATGAGAVTTGGTAGAIAPGTTGTTPAVGGATAPGTATTTTASTTGATATTTGKGGGTTQAATATGPATAACTAAGAPLNIGQVGTYSGVTGPAWAGGRTSVAVWVRWVNDHGGIACHPVVLHFGDDGGDPARAAAIIQDQVKTQGVVAFVGGHDDLSIAGVRQAVEATKTPAIGGDLVASEWNQSPYMFPQGAGLEDQIFGFIKQSADQGHKKVGLLYCVEVAACSVANKVLTQTDLAQQAGASIVYTSAISLTQTDFTAQCQSAKSAGADQLALGMDGSSMARVARSCAAVGYRPLLSGIGGTISPGQAEDPNLRAFTLGTATGTAPWTQTDTPGLKEYSDALAKYAPGEPTSGSSVQLWACGKLLEAAIAKLGAGARDKPLTAAMIIDGLHQIKNESLGGLTASLTFGPGAQKSSGCVFFELLTVKGWTAPRGSKAVCR